MLLNVVWEVGIRIDIMNQSTARKQGLDERREKLGKLVVGVLIGMIMGCGGGVQECRDALEESGRAIEHAREEVPKGPAPGWKTRGIRVMGAIDAMERTHKACDNK